MATFEKLSSNKVKLVLTVPAEKFNEAINQAYRKNVKRISIPGFRKGKAPMQVIERYYGTGVFYEDALDIVFPEAYQAAIQEHSVEVVDQPAIEVTQIGKGKDLEIVCEVFVRPDVKLGAYKNLGIEKEVAEVTDDDVMADIERARDRAARFVEVTDRAAQLDDQVNIDYAGFLGEEQFDGGTAQGHDLVLGSGSFIPGFEEQLVGCNAGDEKDVNVTFPEDYHAENLSGKAVVFKVKVNSISAKEVPALDDEFVKDVSETAETLDDYKAEIRAKLEKQADNRAENAFESAIIEKITEDTEIDIPEAMINEQVDYMLRDMEMQMMYSGMRMEDYYKYAGTTEEKMREMYKPNAEQRVRNQLTIEAIMKVEGIVASDDEVEAEIAKYAEQNKQTVEQFKGNLRPQDMESFKQMTAMQKTVDFLKANAK